MKSKNRMQTVISDTAPESRFNAVNALHDYVASSWITICSSVDTPGVKIQPSDGSRLLLHFKHNTTGSSIAPSQGKGFVSVQMAHKKNA